MEEKEIVDTREKEYRKMRIRLEEIQRKKRGKLPALASGFISICVICISCFFIYDAYHYGMSKYHNKLVISHNVSIALKVAESLPVDEKVKAKNAIISELLKDVNTNLVRSDSSNE